jgi:hypothetical protein
MVALTDQVKQEWGKGDVIPSKNITINGRHDIVGIGA